MRGHFTFSRTVLILAVLWMAMGVPAGALAVEPTSDSPQVVMPEPAITANLTNYSPYYETADTKPIDEKAPAKDAAPAVQVNAGQGCGCCSNSCCPCGNWILDIEAPWLSPQAQDRPLAGYRIVDGDTIVSDDHGGVVGGLFITPRIALGYQGECWGVQARYWRMNENSRSLVPSTETDLTGNTVDNLFKAETVDIEGTRLFCWGDTTNQLAFGVRYAQLEQATNLSVVRETGAGPTLQVFSGNAFSRNEFSGIGPTLGLMGYKPLPCRNFSLFYNVRGSLLWDDGAVNEVQTRASNLGSGASADYARSQANATMFIGEIQLGTQWNFQLCHNCADAFVRLAIEYQYWTTSDTGFVLSDSYAPDPLYTDNYGHATASSGATDVNLIGFTVATGFTW